MIPSEIDDGQSSILQMKVMFSFKLSVTVIITAVML